MNPEENELRISAIREGTVIDHIPADSVFKVAHILSLAKNKEILSLATNLPSNVMGTKGVIKIAKKRLTKTEVNKIAVIAPHATINIIEDYKVKDKRKVAIPKEIAMVIRCSNPQCFTNSQPVNTIFEVTRKEPLKVRCRYCERSMDASEIELK